MKIKIILMSLIVFTMLFTSCQEKAMTEEEYYNKNNQSQDNQNNSTSSSTFSQLKVTPYNYSLRSIGNGMNEGVIKLAIENGGTNIINADDGYFIEFIVETEEGVNYEGTGGFSFDNLGNIPPGIRFYDTAISWQSSQAATPKKIIISTPQDKNSEIIFNLPKQGTTITFPYESSPKKILPISALKDKVLISNDEGLNVRLTGNCILDKNNGTVLLEAEITNNDKFYPHHVEELPVHSWDISVIFSTKYSTNNFYRAISPDGQLRWSTISDDIGPNQTHIYKIRVGSDDAVAMVFIEGDDYSLYDLSDLSMCK